MPTESAAEQYREYTGIELGHVDDDGKASKSDTPKPAKKAAAKKTATSKAK